MITLFRKTMFQVVSLSVLCLAVVTGPALAQEALPWSKFAQNIESDGENFDPSRSTNPGVDQSYGSGSAYNNGPEVRPQDAPYDRLPPPQQTYGNGRLQGDDGIGEPYQAQPSPRRYGTRDDQYEYYNVPDPDAGPYENRRVDDRYYSQGEILEAGRNFFGSVSSGLASVVEYAFQRSGRPTGYILGEDAGGAFVAGLRYGEGRLYTRAFPTRKVFWQGPSLGYDFGAAGSKTMVLVYNLRDPNNIFHRFGGVEGSAYLVGGVSIQFQQHGDTILAPIRSGVGLRLGANIGYLKYTRRPTWNPF